MLASHWRYTEIENFVMAITYGSRRILLPSPLDRMEVMMNIGTLVIRMGMAAFLMAMAGKILRVTVAHSQEAGAEIYGGVELPFATAAMDLGTRPQQAKRGPPAGSSSKPPSLGTADVAKSIRAQDVNCPVVMSVSSRGQDAYGRVFIVRCGSPRGVGRDVFSNLRVTIQANGEAVISPEH
jgi:hypothetical protein